LTSGRTIFTDFSANCLITGGKTSETKKEVEDAVPHVYLTFTSTGDAASQRGITTKSCYKRPFIFLLTYLRICTVSQKNIPDIFDYNVKKDYRIFIIFGKNIPETTCRQVTI